MMSHPAILTPVHQPLSYEAVSRSVFAGRLLKFGGGHALIRAARDLCRNIFELPDPQKAHRHYDKEEFLRRADKAQKAFNTDTYKQLFAEWLETIGINRRHLYWDTLGLRIAPPVQTHGGGFRSSIGVHRDTWGSAIQAQINWWAPVFPLAKGRTMAFYPAYWHKGLANTTAEWSFQSFLAARRRASAGHAADYPSAPHATEQPQTEAALLMMRCNELLAFAAAHLHGSVPNKTKLTRFSLEIRTVHLTHIRRQKGAPNVDCASTPPLYRLFRAMDGNYPLAPDNTAHA